MSIPPRAAAQRLCAPAEGVSAAWHGVRIIKQVGAAAGTEREAIVSGQHRYLRALGIDYFHLYAYVYTDKTHATHTPNSDWRQCYATGAVVRR